MAEMQSCNSFTGSRSQVAKDQLPVRARLRQVNCWGRGAVNRVDAEIDGLQIPALISVPRCAPRSVAGFCVADASEWGAPQNHWGNVDSIDHVSTLVRTLLRERSIDPLTEVDAVRAPRRAGC